MVVALVMLYALPGAQARAGTGLTVDPGVHFVAEGAEAEVSVAVDCPAMAFLTIDITFNGTHIEYVDGSAACNPPA